MFNTIKLKFFNKQFLTFGIIGGINTFLAQFIYYFSVTLGFFPLGFSSFIGDTIPIFISYVLNAKFTYHEPLNWKNALTFPIAYLPGIFINMLIVLFTVYILNFPEEYAKLISLPITIPLNFLCVSFVMKFTKKKVS